MQSRSVVARQSQLRCVHIMAFVWTVRRASRAFLFWFWLIAIGGDDEMHNCTNEIIANRWKDKHQLHDLGFFYWFFCLPANDVRTNRHVHTNKHTFAITLERWVTLFVLAYFFLFVAEILFIKFALNQIMNDTSHNQTLDVCALTHYISGEKKTHSFACSAAVCMETNKNEKNAEFGWMCDEWCSWNRKSWGKIEIEIFMMANGRSNVETRTRRHTFPVK